MENINKKPDKKLALGAKMGFITNIITSIMAIIILIIAIVAIAAAKKIVNDGADVVDPSGTTKNLFNGLSIPLFVIVIIFMLIIIIISALVAFKCKHILQGKAENGMTIGILLLVIAGLGLVGLATKNPGAIIGTLVMIGLNGASGVLLIMGKYVTPENADKEVEVVSSPVI